MRMRMRTKHLLIIICEIVFIIACIAIANESSQAVVIETVLAEPEAIDLDSIFNEYSLKLKEILNLTKRMLPSASSLLQSVAPEAIPFVSDLDEVKIRVVDKEAFSEKDPGLIREILAKFDERELGPKGWKLVMKSDQKDNVTGVYARLDAEEVKGLFVYNGSSKMISIVNLMGKIDLSKISNLMLVGSKRHIYTPQGEIFFQHSPLIEPLVIEPTTINPYTGVNEFDYVFGVNRLKSTNTYIIDNDAVRLVIDNDRACVTGVTFKKGSNTELIDTWALGNALFYLGSKDKKLRSGWKSDRHEVRGDSADFHFVKDGGYEVTIRVKWSDKEVTVTNEFTLPEPVAINNNINLTTPTPGISTVSFGTPYEISASVKQQLEEARKKLEEAKKQLGQAKLQLIETRRMTTEEAIEQIRTVEDVEKQLEEAKRQMEKVTKQQVERIADELKQMTEEVKEKVKEAKMQLELELKSVPVPPALLAQPQVIVRSSLDKPSKAFWALPTEKGVESGEYTFSGPRTGHYPKGRTMGKELFKPSEPWIAFWRQDRDETYGFTFSDGYEFSIESESTTDFELKIPQGKSEISFHVIKGKSSPEYEKIRALVKE